MFTHKTLYTTSIFIFIFTFSFAYSFKIVKNITVPDYIKCLTGGVILTTMIFHILPHMYEHKSMFGPFTAGISFLTLFSIDKIYLSRVAVEQDALPHDADEKQAFIFVLAMSIHSFMEGLGVPVKTAKELKWYMFGLVGHKWIEAIVLGVSVFQREFSEAMNFSLIFVYSILTPLGIILGKFSVNYFSNSKGILINLLIGISAGSFFYIGFLEMLDNGFVDSNSSRDDWIRVGLIFTGFILMGVVNFITEKLEEKGKED
ncbi:hypothetical protein H312_00164 [Anncaliia algerae PRA339]|uniref:Zinc/iron permease n=1 Tax=Anncaliia algerae PRA339 TaxID=1288291 RepID=A0A059F6A5_9MICR|nr:hypothetical protein H312_00164 [Anncaliia algerae PRA339]